MLSARATWRRKKARLMNSSKTLVILAVLLVGCVVATYVSSKLNAPPQTQQAQSANESNQNELQLTFAPRLPDPTATSAPGRRISKPKTPVQPVEQPTETQTTSPNPVQQAALARESLTMVGVSAEANEYWFAAVNNPEVPTIQRQVLIAALSEVGFEDPNNPTEEELPLIMSRITLLQRLAQNPLDQASATAIQATSAALVDMAAQVTGE